jgi:Ras-related protein Rab-1A
LGIPFLETSAKNSSNVEAAFVKMAEEIKNRVGNVPAKQQANKATIKPGESVSVKQEGGCC